jgi:hypothetical protein
MRGASRTIAAGGVDTAPSALRCALRRDGAEWIVLFDGRSFRLNAAKGIDYLVALLGRPGESIPALELASPGEPGGSSSDSRDAERARINVVRAIGRALLRIAERHAQLALYLTKSVRTGSSCSYTPDARAPIRFDL